MTDLIASEWHKIRSVRSTYYLLGSGGALTAVLVTISGFVRTSEWDAAPPAARAGIEPLGTGLGGGPIQILTLIMGAYGVLAITSEYATGAIRSSLLAVPQRPSFLLAKTAAVAATGFAAALALVSGLYAITQAITGPRPIGTPLPSASGQLLATAFTLGVVAVVGLGLGTILRSTAGGLVSLFTITIILPAVRELPDPWGAWLGSATLPGLAGRLIAGDNPPLAIAGLLTWAAAAILTGLLVLKRRDV